MLAALAGFDSKTDKYVMQRLLRAGDINAKNREVSVTFIKCCKRPKYTENISTLFRFLTVWRSYIENC